MRSPRNHDERVNVRGVIGIAGFKRTDATAPPRQPLQRIEPDGHTHDIGAALVAQRNHERGGYHSAENRSYRQPA